MAPELRPGHLLDEFLERAEAAGQCDESIGALEHRALALVHVVGDDQLLGEPPRPFGRGQKLRDDPGHFTAMLDHGGGKRSHQADGTAAIDQAKAIFAEDFAEVVRRLDKGRVSPWVRSAVDAQRIDFAHRVTLMKG